MVDVPQIIEGSKQLGLAYVILQSELSRRVLGPTADYIGNEIKLFTEKRITNLKNIFENAEKKLGDKISEEGKVPPKVIRSIINEGSYCEDELSMEYFGGLLASSRSGIVRDDRAAYYVSLLSHLSSYQIRTHYIFYQILKKYFDGSDLNIGIERERKKMVIYVPIDEYSQAMEFVHNENRNTIVAHSIVGLIKENLLDRFYAIGNVDIMKGICERINNTGVIFQPSAIGVELFLWACGRPELSVQEFFSKNIRFDFDIDIKTPQNCIITDGIN